MSSFSVLVNLTVVFKFHDFGFHYLLQTFVLFRLKITLHFCNQTTTCPTDIMPVRFLLLGEHPSKSQVASVKIGDNLTVSYMPVAPLTSKAPLYDWLHPKTDHAFLEEVLIGLDRWIRVSNSS